MNILELIARFFRVAFGIEDTVTEPKREFVVGDKVTYGTRTGEIESVDTDVDPTSPYSVKFDDSEEVEGTFSAEELTLRTSA